MVSLDKLDLGGTRVANAGVNERNAACPNPQIPPKFGKTGLAIFRPRKAREASSLVGADNLTRTTRETGTGEINTFARSREGDRGAVNG
jgi:hypothetical protein